MGVLLVANGRVVFARGSKRRHPKAPDYRDAQGNPLDVSPIGSTDPERPPSAGHVVTDAVERIAYRVLAKVDPLAGWGVAPHWEQRYSVTHAGLLALVRAGLVDAAMERGSAVRYYRVRDDWQVQAFLETRPKLRVQHPRTRKGNRKLPPA